MSEPIVVEVKMGGHWKGPGVALKTLISDLIAIHNMRNVLPEDWWDDFALQPTTKSIPIVVLQAEDGSLRIRKRSEPEGHLLASA